MGDRLPKPLRKLITGFQSFTAGQKAVTIAAVLALVIGGYFFATWAAKPSYSALFNNLSGKDAAAIVESLDKTGTAYELSNNGATILVPQDQVNALRIQLSGEGLPGDADTGYALLDEQGITTSDFMQHVGYQRALEGELSNTIKSIEGVEAATVHLVIPQKDVFADDQSAPTASVLVASKGTSGLSNSQVQSIVHLVASSVEGLDPTQVTVAGSDGKVLSAGGGAAVGAGDGDARSQAVTGYENKLNMQVQTALEKVLGPGNAVVTTAADLDFDTTTTESLKYGYDPANPPLIENTKTETYNGNGNQAGGVLGPDNIQVPGSATGGNGQYQNTDTAKTNPLDQIKETRKSAGGSVRKLNISVLMNSRTAGAVDAAQVQQLVSAAVGIDATRGDTIAVAAMPFDTSAAEQRAKELAAAGAADKQATQLSYAKTGALVLLLLVLLFMAWRASRKKKRSQLNAAELAQLEEMQAALEMQRLAELNANIPAQAIEAGPDPDDELRKDRQREISQMVDDQPDEVAALLRGWLAERR
jgi:flagellar M-ring protein FliF